MDDLISRKAAIDELRKCQTYRLYEGDDEPKIERSNAEAVIMHLPSEQTAQQEQTGRWSQVSGQATLCSCCGRASNAKQARNWNYCPYCGAKMEEIK